MSESGYEVVRYCTYHLVVHYEGHESTVCKIRETKIRSSSPTHQEQPMYKRRYTIEATTRTLVRFLGIVERNSNVADTLVNRVNTNSTEEYHYVVLTADKEIHDKLRSEGYLNSYTMSDSRG